MTGERVWVTGIGLVTALAGDAPTTWRRLLEGDRGFFLQRAPGDETGHADIVAAVSDVLTPPGSPSPGAGWSRTTALAWQAAREAMTQAGFGPGNDPGRRVGLVVGGTTGGMFETEALLARMHADPVTAPVDPALAAQPLTATTEWLARLLGPFCRTRTICSACSSGANAFMVGALWVLSGDVDVAIVGGSDGLCRLTRSGFHALGAIDSEACRPFDVRRKGLNLGEGAGFAVLERATSVRARGGGVVAELVGWAGGAEAHHVTNPEKTGRAGLSPGEIDYVNAHGTGTPLNDPMEAAALALALGAEVARVPVSSSKGQIGHTLGAAGAVEAVVSLLAVKEQAIPPTMGLEEPDPACPLVHVTHRGRPARVRAALSNSFGFGGMDTVLAFAEPELCPPRVRTNVTVVVSGAATLTAHGLDDGATASRLAVTGPGTGDAAKGGPLSVDFAAHLDVARARRLDRSGRLGTTAAQAALAQASSHGRAIAPSAVGAIFGTALGTLDASAAFMHRVLGQRGRFASPAAFPNLVPSAPVGHASIYLGLRGPTFAVADVGTSGECAVTQAIELVAAGIGEVMVAGAVEEASLLVERVLPVLLPSGPRRALGDRSEGSAMLVLEAEDRARERGARPLAIVSGAWAWVGTACPTFSAPREIQRARVVSAREDGAVDASLVGTVWAEVARVTVSRVAGDHEGTGGVALVVAASMVHTGVAEEVLVLGVAGEQRCAVMLTADIRREESA